MSNERLRAAVLTSDLSIHSLAEHVGVDPKTVERWISKDRVPHRSHRIRAAQVLHQDDAYLWPTVVEDPATERASAAELVQFWPNRGTVPVERWIQLTEHATEAIDLLAFAGSFLHDALPGFTDLLERRARAGVRVRLLFGDPDSEAVARRGAEEGIGDGMAARVRLTWAYFAPLLDVPGVEARQHGQTLYASLFRFDGDLFVNSHTIGQAASHSPVLHIRQIPGARVFRHHMQGFEQTWESANPPPA